MDRFLAQLTKRKKEFPPEQNQRKKKKIRKHYKTHGGKIQDILREYFKNLYLSKL